MTSELPSTYERFHQRYLDGQIPWDDPLPPPEVIELVETLPPGRMLDLGCGFGRSCIYLALHGWVADGVDFIPQAIEVAQARAEVAHVSDKTRFFASSATDMPFLTPSYDLAIDIGCMHSFDESALRAYRAELLRLVPTRGTYLLFAHLSDGSEPIDDRPSGIAEATIVDLFADDFELDRLEKGTTQVDDRPPWSSGWFWYRRL